MLTVGWLVNIHAQCLPAQRFNFSSCESDPCKLNPFFRDYVYSLKIPKNQNVRVCVSVCAVWCEGSIPNRSKNKIKIVPRGLRNGELIEIRQVKIQKYCAALSRFSKEENLTITVILIKSPCNWIFPANDKNRHRQQEEQTTTTTSISIDRDESMKGRPTTRFAVLLRRNGKIREWINES